MAERWNRVLVCGGRDYDDWEAVRNRLAKLPNWCVIIQGGASGVDLLAKLAADYLGMHTAEVPAQWTRYGKSAGPRRNAAMLALRPELVIAFPGGRGTANCIRQARAAGIRVEDRSGLYGAETGASGKDNSQVPKSGPQILADEEEQDG